MTGWHKAFKECLKLYTLWVKQKKKYPAYRNNPLQKLSGILLWNEEEAYRENITSVAGAVRAPHKQMQKLKGQVASQSAIVVSFTVLDEWSTRRGVTGASKWNWKYLALGHTKVQLQTGQTSEHTKKHGWKSWNSLYTNCTIFTALLIIIVRSCELALQASCECFISSSFQNKIVLTFVNSCFCYEHTWGNNLNCHRHHPRSNFPA